MFTKKECLCIIKKNSAEINYTIQFARIKSSKIQLRMPFFYILTCTVNVPV